MSATHMKSNFLCLSKGHILILEIGDWRITVTIIHFNNNAILIRRMSQLDIFVELTLTAQNTAAGRHHVLS